MRRSLTSIGIVVLVFSIAGYFLSRPILKYFHDITNVRLAAYGVPDAFFALLNIAFAFGVFVSVPYISYMVLAALPSLFPTFSKKMMLTFWIASIILFYIGAFFCLNISLPYGARFLVSFERSDVQAIISVRKLVSFCTLFIFGFGIVFEMPIAMVLLGRLGIISVRMLTASRKYAILVISVAAAILTPTPDVVNMMLMAVPLYLLFELGILAMRLLIK